MTHVKIPEHYLTFNGSLKAGEIINVSYRINPCSKKDAVTAIKQKIVDIDTAMVEEHKKAVKAGYDMSIISIDMNVIRSELKKLSIDLQDSNDGVFLAVPHTQSRVNKARPRTGKNSQGGD